MMMVPPSLTTARALARAHVDAVDGVNQRAGLAMGLHHVARHGLDDVVIVVHHHVEQEAGFGQQGGFFKIGVKNIAGFHIGAAHRRIGAAAKSLVQGQVVVPLDGLVAGDAGQQILGAAAVPGQKVIHHAAGQDDMVALHGKAVKPHLRAVAGHARLDHIRRIAALVVNNLNTVVNILGNNGDVLLARHGAVRARGREYTNVRIADAAFVQTGHHSRNINIGRLPQAGGVRHDNADRLAGFEHFLKPGRTDGIIQSFVNVLQRAFCGQRNRIGMQLRRDEAVAKLHRKFPVAVFHVMLCHESCPCLLLCHKCSAGPCSAQFCRSASSFRVCYASCRFL